MLVPAPTHLDEAGSEELLGRLARLPRAPEAIDCSAVRFADPSGALALVSIGMSAEFRRGNAWGLVLPREPAVLAWLGRSGVLRLLEELFVVAGAPGEAAAPRRAGEHDPVLLEAVTVREGADIHRAVARIKARADLLLVSRLGYSGLAADRFTVALAEILQNAVDHSGSAGVALAQCYTHAPGGPEIRLAVTDVGIGVRASLGPRYASRFPEGWDDRTAIALAFESGVTGSGDPDRGLGLAAVSDLVRAWGGTLRLRSGTAARVVGAHPSERAGLPGIPGTQVGVRLPHAADRR